MRFRRTASKCGECPLNRMKKVWSMCDVEAPKIIILGEAPGANEDAEGKPFVGAAGAKLKDAVAQSGMLWHTVWKTNVICCRPPNNEIGSDEAQEAIECCRPGFEQEMKELERLGAKVVIPMGNTAVQALGLKGAVGKIRGSVYKVGKLVAVPAYHPSFIMRGMWKEEPTWIGDLKKAKELSLKEWKPPKEKFNLFPSEEDVKVFCKKAIDGKKLVAVDIETTSLSEYHSKIIMIGLALNGEEALVVPFTKQGGAAYWGLTQEIRVRKMVGEMLEKCPTMFQNASFDVRHLEAHGYKVGNIKEDTMLAHHAIHPELPHNLEYIVSVYGDTPAWKEVVKGSESRMVNMDDAEVRTYNARDTVVLHQIIGELHKDLEEFGTMQTYRRWSMRMLRPLIEMSKEGMLIDKRRLEKAKKKFEKEAAEGAQELVEMLGLPEGFNLESGYHLQMLVYGEKPKNFGSWMAEYKGYIDPESKKRKDTKKFRELEEKVKVYSYIKPLRLPKIEVRKTNSGYALDDEAFLQLQRATIKRLDALEDRAKKGPDVKAEIEGLRKTLKFFEVYRKYAIGQKFASTYSGYPLGPDGRVHPGYKIHGTATGRISASEPNLQNQPAAVQDVFVAGVGRSIVKADYSNIELRVLGYITGEKNIIEAFDKGLNIHDVNTKMLFEIDENHPDWKEIRRAAKIYVFGRSYGGGVEGIYKQVLTEVPSIPMTKAHFVECDRRYFEKMDSYRKWRDKVQKQARETRIVETAFGRKRILLGTPDEIERQALNTPIQGTAGEIAMEALCDLYEEIEKSSRKKWKARLVLTVHDSILVECDEEYKVDVAKLMKRVMEKEWTVGGRRVKFPVDVEIGPSWGETEVVKV